MTGRVLLSAIVLILSIGLPAAGQESAVCAARSPEADWGLIEAPVDRYAAVVSEGHAARYADESSGSQQMVIMWNPSLGRSAAAAASAAPTHMADLVRFGSARDGDASLPVPVASVRTDLEARRRETLTIEPLDAAEPATTWPSGLAIAIGIVLLAIVTATMDFISNRRAKRRPKTPQPIPRFFDSSGPLSE